ncbi:MAG: T9SS type A sorting domain-containing protein [Cytophagaceae bacterium]|nr:T9SS type A sorting domain-containing protein [Cytophagaceae bacterium]
MNKSLLQLSFFIVFGLITLVVKGQTPVNVTKTNSKRVYMHMMPWFDGPMTLGANNWGYHWKMQKMNPNIIVDPATGKRQIASHYYPLTGPYDSSDPDIIDYQMLLMKLAGVDGVLIDWYGTAGNVGDIGSNLRNSNAIVNGTAPSGLKFGLIVEDRFTGGDVNIQRNSMLYARDNYFSKSNYIRSNNDPLVGIFGPELISNGGAWNTILSGINIEFLPLEYQGGEVGGNMDGEYAWPYQTPGTSDHYSQVENFYRNRAPGLKTAMGVAYPGFNDFYAQGENNGTSYFNIPYNGTGTLNQMFNLVNQYNNDLDIVQLATWNDYGEGTMFEPTREFGYSFLVRLQQFTGVSYTEADLKQVTRYYNLRKQYPNDAAIRAKLDQVYKYFAALQISNAVALMCTIDNAAGCVSIPKINITSGGTVAEGGSNGTFTISGTNISGNVTVNYTISGSASSSDYNANPGLSGAVVLTSGQPSMTITVNAVDDALVESTETLVLNLSSSGSYTIGTGSAQLSITDNEPVPPFVSITSSGTPVEGGATGAFTITGNNVTATTTVFYTISGTGSVADYTANPTLSGSIQLTSAQPSRTITIAAVDDVISETAETLIINLSSNAAYGIGQGSAQLSILDNEPVPCVAPVIAFTSSAPVIDQTVDAVWAKAPVGTINKVSVGSLPADMAGTQWRAMYDNTYLYVLVEVKDNNKFNDSGTSWWDDDVIELFLDGNNSKGAAYDGVNDYQLAFRYNDAAVKVGSGVMNTSGLNFAMANKSDGYTLEVRIPWSSIGTAPAVGKAIGFELSVDDDDNGAGRDAQVSAFSTTGTAYQSPGVFGTVFETTCDAVIIIAPVITSSLTTSGTVGQSFSYTITASNNPTSYGASQLPAGLSINTSTGVISGTPTVAATNNVTITAANSAGTSTKTLVLTVTSDVVNGNGDGLMGNYFNGMNFETLAFNRKDATLSMDWGTGSPDASVAIDKFSARWTGQVQSKYSEVYTFFVSTDDGRRLWINNQLVVDKWFDDGGTEYSGTIPLIAGQKYEIKLEYYENGGGAKVNLQWSSTSQSKQVVPTSQLYANVLPTVSITSPAANASFAAPAAIAISVNTSDNNGTMAKVEYFNGAVKIGESVTAPFGFSWTGVTEGAYSIKARATDNLGGVSESAAVPVSVTGVNNGTGNGLLGNYFNGMNFETAVYSRTDATISFDWGNGSPNTAVNADQFSARWIGQVQPMYSGEYTFYVNSDNGRRLWINNQLIVDKWLDDWNIEYSGKIILNAGQKYDIKLEYFENNGGAACKLEWSSASQSRQIIPQSQLYSTTQAVNQTPVIALTSPSSNQSYTTPASISITANATDADGSIGKVEFYNGSQKLGEDASAPYTYNWTNVGAGDYTITAKAYDNLGAVTTTSSVAVSAVNVVSDLCSGLGTYSENNGYVPGSKVKNNGRRFECKEYPYSGWCNGSSWAYAPGTGAYWIDAWYDRGTCNARTSTEAITTASSAVLISPNPSFDVITIHLEVQSNVSIYNAQGVEVKTVHSLSPEGTINMSELASGMYLIKIDTGSEVLTRSIIKN